MKHISSSKFLYLGLVSSLAGISTAALAENTGPTVYGKLDVSLVSADHESATPAKDQWELNSNASRLGVKGSLDLKETDLAVIYQAEYGIDADDGSTPFSQRNIFAGLKGSFGELRFGKFDTPLKVIDKVEQFADTYGDLDLLIGGSNRASNIVQYSSPTLADAITVNAAFIPAEGANVDGETGNEDGLTDTLSMSVVFDNKTIFAALAYDMDQAAGKSVDGISRGDIMRLVAGWKQDAIELGALFQQTSDNAAGSEREDTSYLVSGAFKADKFKFKLQYGMSDGDVTNNEGTITAVGVDYSLASKTIVYLYGSLLELDNATGADPKDTSFGLGFAHSF